MSWTLLTATPGAIRPTEFALPNEGITHIVITKEGRTQQLGVVNELRPGLHVKLGRITVGQWGAKLEAVDDTLIIRSAQASTALSIGSTIDPRSEQYKLKPCTDGRSEAIFIRHGDVISSTGFTDTLTCIWKTPEIQVNSSAAEAGEVKLAVPNDVAEASDDDTEDEGDIHAAVVAVSATQAKSQQSLASPRLSNQQRIIVQETPTAARVDRDTDFSIAPGADENRDTVSPNSPSRQVEDQTDMEPFSTARTGKLQDEVNEIVVSTGITIIKPTSSASPNRSALATVENFANGAQSTSCDESTPRQPSRHTQVVNSSELSKKRPSPSSDEQQSNVETVGRSSKRIKNASSSQQNSQDSRMSNIVVETTQQTQAKGKKRSSTALDTKDAASPRSQKSPPCSSVNVPKEYDGPIPHVAFSHSAIAFNSQAVKFLKKQGGSVEESITSKCNVLCVRIGALTKTMKLLESIARGIPVVTDRWLLDSAKAGRFLALHTYIPSVPKQEAEWNFKLEKIWGNPQSPFQGFTLYFTPELQKSYADFEEIKQVCRTVGATVATKKTNATNALVLAKDDSDKDLEKFIQDGTMCFSKDILTNSILRGEVDVDSEEFMIQPGTTSITTDSTKPVRKTGRKS